MGCVPHDDRCDEAEKPRVRHTFPQFEMLDREVRSDDFRVFARSSSRQMPRQPEWYADGTHPVVNVTWDEATAYCAWAGGRLPTEAEWEHAARGGLDGKLFPWGDEFTGQANGRHTLKTELFDFTAPTATFPPNAFGLYNVTGNVWEWCADWYDTGYYSRSPGDNPQGPMGGTRRVSRGGSYLCHLSYCRRYRVSARNGTEPASSLGNLGFRVARGSASASRP